MHRSGSLAEKREDPAVPLRAVRVSTPHLIDSESSARGPRRSQGWLEGIHALVAYSRSMRELRHQIEQVAGTDASVLLVGESGSGKELVARAIHELSSRSAGKFLKLSCAAQPAEQLECSLFGCAPAEGADRKTEGLFESAEDGTLFLDRITEMPASTQMRLVEMLGDNDPVGGGGVGPARLITATSADVRRCIEDGTLRADAYYRLSVFTLRVPSLRERQEDLPHLINDLMDAWSEAFMRPRLPITRRILDFCATYAWPGNLRELENFVKRYLVLGEEKMVIEQLEGGAQAEQDGSIQIALPLRGGSLDLKSLMRDIKKDAERAAILQALERTGGNKQKAARLLRISLRSLHYKVRAYGIEPAHVREQTRLEFGATLQYPSSATPPTGGSGKLLSMDRTLPAAS